MSDFKAPESSSTSIQLTAIPDIPEIRKGDSFGMILVDCLANASIQVQDRDIFAIAHKVISKAEGQLVNLQQVVPGKRAQEVADITQKDPRLVELILAESDEISRMREGVLIVRHRLGFTSANAGIDRSNVPQDDEAGTNVGDSGEWVLLLPTDPDASAEQAWQRPSSDRRPPYRPR